MSQAEIATVIVGPNGGYELDVKAPGLPVGMHSLYLAPDPEPEPPHVLVRIYHDGRVTLDNGRPLSPTAQAQLAEAIRRRSEADVELACFLGNIGA